MGARGSRSGLCCQDDAVPFRPQHLACWANVFRAAGLFFRVAPRRDEVPAPAQFPVSRGCSMPSRIPAQSLIPTHS